MLLDACLDGMLPGAGLDDICCVHCPYEVALSRTKLPRAILGQHRPVLPPRASSVAVLDVQGYEAPIEGRHLARCLSATSSSLVEV